jgi:hypothetical protein
LPGKCRSQTSSRPGWASSRSSSRIVSVSGSVSRFFGVRNGSAGSLDPLLLQEEAEETLERGGRPRLARDRGAALLLLGEEGAQVRHPNLAEVANSLCITGASHTSRRGARLMIWRDRDPLVHAESVEATPPIGDDLTVVCLQRRHRPRPP